ncbi:hypothetical protein BDB01DRAFT_735111 [Pilobolus umbonatus]|nr:hypothetical protein BDB01DRAFT_735111 [Pilobolus umbonatus]
MHRSSSLSLKISNPDYLIKHVNSVLDSNQFVKKTHALSTAVNVIHTQVTPINNNSHNHTNYPTENNSSNPHLSNTTLTTETSNTTLSHKKWNSMDASSAERHTLDTFEQAYSSEEDEDSDLDITGVTRDHYDNSIVTTKTIVHPSTHFEFHFEFGSKRPPSAVIASPDSPTSCMSEEEEQYDNLFSDKEPNNSYKLSNEEHSRYNLSDGLSDGEHNSSDTLSDEDQPSEEEHDNSDEEHSNGDVISVEDNSTDTLDTVHLPSVTTEAMEAYENITENIYIGSATGRSMAEESMPCECKYDSELDDMSEACGDDTICINRMMFMECIMQDCPCGRLCRNRRFQLGQYARVDVIKTEKKGYGLRALDDLPMNTFIMEYIGEVIPQSEFIMRTREYDAEGFKHYYFMTLKNDEIIDATRRGCLARFINHSCSPNCVTQKWVIGKKMRIGIFTKRPIKSGEELTFDYKFERYGATAQECYCGEYNCKGFIGSDEKTVDEEIKDNKLINIFSSDEDENESEDEDVDIIIQRQIKAEPLQDPDMAQSFVKRMLNSVGKPRLVNKLLMRLKMTNPNNSQGREILKTIIRLHGLKMLKFWLGEWKNNEAIVIKVLQVLKQLPLANRNGLEDCKLYDVVQKFIDHDNDDISQLSHTLLDRWNQLKCVYRIPKRNHLEIADKPTVSIEEDTPTETVMSSKKKHKFISTREYFDPDDDYFEYLTLDSTLSDIESKMQYPPQPMIPIAPKAMMDASNMKRESLCKSYNHKRESISKRESINNTSPLLTQSPLLTSYQSPLPTYQSPLLTFYQSPTLTSYQSPTSTPYQYLPHKRSSHFNCHVNIIDSTIKANHGILMTTSTSTGSNSTSTMTSNNSIVNSNFNHSSSTTDVTLSPTDVTLSSTDAIHSPLDNIHHSDSHNNIDQLNYYHHYPPATMDEYYYYTYYRQHYDLTPANGLPAQNTLPSNWQAAMTEDGSTYYYNTSTLETQWELPEEKTAAIEMIDCKKPSVMTEYEDSPTSSKGSHLLTPTASTSESIDAEEGIYLNDIDLKREVGKVVTRHLSAKQQSLWKGDKYLFKDLARKVTHHIVDRELQSGRRIKSMDGSLRIKIERFIDVYGSDYVLKLIHRNNSTNNSPSTYI